MTGRFLDGLAHFIVAVEIKDIGDEVECILVILNFCVQAGEIEAICEVVLVDLAEILVSSGGYELEVRSKVVRGQRMWFFGRR